MSKVAENEVIETLRVLSTKMPNLAELVARATAPIEKRLEETAYVYNGYADKTLVYLGAFEYFIPFGKVTKIDGKPEYREPNQQKSAKGQIVWETIPMKGESIAREIIENRKYNELGIVVFTETPAVDKETGDFIAPKELKKVADEIGRIARLSAIQAFRIGREKAKSGIAGHPMRPPDHLIPWLSEYAPDDEFFANQSTKTDQMTVLTNAFSMMAEMFSRIVPKSPKRKPMESTEDFAKRIAAWREANTTEIVPQVD